MPTPAAAAGGGGRCDGRRRPGRPRHGDRARAAALHCRRRGGRGGRWRGGRRRRVVVRFGLVVILVVRVRVVVRRGRESRAPTAAPPGASDVAAAAGASARAAPATAGAAAERPCRCTSSTSTRRPRRRRARARRPARAGGDAGPGAAVRARRRARGRVGRVRALAERAAVVSAAGIERTAGFWIAVSHFFAAHSEDGWQRSTPNSAASFGLHRRRCRGHERKENRRTSSGARVCATLSGNCARPVVHDLAHDGSTSWWPSAAWYTRVLGVPLVVLGPEIGEKRRSGPPSLELYVPAVHSSGARRARRASARDPSSRRARPRRRARPPRCARRRRLRGGERGRRRRRR